MSRPSRYFNDPEYRAKIQKQEKEYKQKHKESYRLYQKTWRGKHKDQIKAYQRLWRKKHPEDNLRHINNSIEAFKRKARQLLRNAIRNGVMKKQPCKVCKDQKAQAHHPDYNKPLAVIWLCPLHHAQIHSPYFR
jgi:hypothetical protein